MEQNILDAITRQLETAPEFFVPVKKLWQDLKSAGEPNLPDLETLTAKLKVDKQFVMEEFHNAPWSDDPEETETMEDLGYYSGPRVRLASRTPTKADMEQIILRHTQKIIDNLVKAYETRPKDLPDEEEAQLIEAMLKAKKLKEEITKTISNPEKEEHE